jgi:amino acid adenylation domain-containing protein
MSHDRTIEASLAQERLWFFHELQPGSALNNLASLVPLAGPHDAGLLERGLQLVVDRHDALRTTFALRDGRCVQRIAPSVHIQLGRIEVSHEAEASRVASELARRPFDLERGPLVRATLLAARQRQWLLVEMHQIVGDRRSMALLEDELAIAYRDLVAGRTPALPALAMQFTELAAAQRTAMASAPSAEHLRYWRQRLDGAPSLFELPYDRPRPPAMTYRGARQAFRLSEAVTTSLQQLSRAEQTAPFVTVLTAFYVLLHRYSGRDDIVIGSPVENRNLDRARHTIGPFSNTLVLRGDLSGSPTFRELLGRVRSMVQGAVDHQDLPFEQLLADLQPERSLAYSPLFQVVFELETAADRERIELDLGTSRFDLAVVLEEHPRGLRGSFQYNADLFDAATIERMARHFERLLAEVAAEPSRSIATVQLLDGHERHQLLNAWNDTAHERPRDRCIHERFSEQARRSPDAVVVFEGTRLRYDDLDRRANALAHDLRARGVAPDQPVGICVERSLEMVVAMLGVLKAGGAYVPLDPAYPPERLAFMLRDSGASVVVSQAQLFGQVRALVPDVATVDASEFLRGAGRTDAPTARTRPDHLAYIIYTSGSTGNPKGVMVSHGAVVNFLSWLVRSYGLGRSDRFLMYRSPSFDVSVWELFGSLLAGSDLVIAKYQEPAHLLELILAHGVTAATFVPSLLEVLLADPRLRAGGSLRSVTCGAEPLTAALQERFFAALPKSELYNAYGPTETTVASTRWRCIPGDRRGVVPIGRPIDNTRVYVLDARGQLVPIGVPGELYIAGDSVARGYHDRPELTAKAFLPDPFEDRPGARMYRTGDRVRWSADGQLEFLGRFDDQVKVRGFRIELGEIEAVLAKHPLVGEFAVVAREDSPGDKRLVAYVVPHGPGLRPNDLKSHLRAKLPEHMIPSAFVVLDEMPLTPNGKVDRKKLPAPEAISAEYVAPRTPSELAMAGIFSEVLRIPRVGALDDFFALGGHSLLATQVVSRMRTRWAIEVPLRALFEEPTVAGLARTIDAAQTGARPSAGGAIARVSRDGALELSFAQERLWFLHQLEPGPLYNVPVVIELRGAIDLAALRRSFAAVIARHEALRTTFASRDGRPIQVIAPELQLELPTHDLGHLAAVDRRAEAMRLANEDARVVFDLEHGPLIRARIVTLDREEHWLLVTIHHIVTDGWSFNVFWRELAAIYDALVAGRRAELPPLAIHYADFAAWQRTWMSGAVLDDKVRYWKTQLAGAPPLLELPTDRPRPPVISYRGAQHAFTLPAKLVTSLQALGRSEQATVFMTVLAAFQTLLHRYSGQDDIVVGSPVANRNRQDIEDLVGFFVNTLPLRGDLSGNPSFRQLLARVRETALAAYDHQDIPFEKLVAELQPERSLAYPPLFQVMLVWQTGYDTHRIAGVDHTVIELPNGTSKFDLTLAVEERGDELVGTLEYNTDLFDAATTSRMLAHLQRILEAVVADPDQRVASLPLLGEDERRELFQWNATDATFEVDCCLHEIVEQQVDRTPDALAVVARDARLTYRQLEERANQLAHYLRAHGAGPEQLVGVFLERSAELVIALLAAHKSGAAFVALDPKYPKDRLATIHDDARPAVLVTQASLLDQVPPVGSHVVCVDTDRATLARQPSSRPERLARPKNLSHVIYTSGSTGRPKGVAIEHTVMVNYTRFSHELHPQEERGAWLFATSVGFDMSLFEMFTPLSWGGRIHVVDDLFALGTMGDRDGVSYVNAVPSVLAAYLRVGSLPGSVVAVSCAGEPLSNALVNQIYAAGVRRVYDFYGPTETFIATYCLRTGEGTPIIGKPGANMQAYVLDSHGALVPRGVRGELYVGGNGVARGYLRRPDLTAERFVHNPFGSGPLYKTGDVVRWLPDGTLTYVGRADYQVKIRGVRIEPGEIEVLLSNHPDVRTAAVVAREDTPSDKYLVAYVVGKMAPPSTDDLRAYLRARLPEYMVPAAFVAMDELPQTPNGKIDRKALPAPDRGRAAVTRAYVPPQTPTEIQLATIWSEVLGIATIGLHDNFFELGGHSLLATQVVSRVRSVFGVELPLRALFEQPTVGGMAVKIASGADHSVGTAITKVPRDRPMALSFAQQRLWFLDQLEPGSLLYNEAFVVELRGTLDLPRLERALQQVVSRHESLRTKFVSIEGRPAQVISPELKLAIDRVDLRQVPAADRDAAARRKVIEAAHQPFDLAQGPLIRAQALLLAPDHHWLVVAIHHIVHDGWSTHVLLRELVASYRGDELAPLAIQYADFAAWQRDQQNGSELARQLDYWKGQLEGAPQLLELPTDRPRPAAMRYHGALHAFQLPASLAQALAGVSREESATLFMTLLAAFQVLLQRYSGQDDILIGSAVANRNRTETEALIGFFVNTLVLRGRLAGNPTFRQLLRQARETALGAYAHQDVPFEKLVEELRPERSMSYAPLVQVNFVLQNTPDVAAMPKLQQRIVDMDMGVARFDLTLIMDERPDGIQAFFEYDVDLFDRATIERMAGHLVTLLEGIAADPDRPIGKLPCISERERRRMIDEWNDTARDWTRDRCMHELFEARALRQPDALAVIGPGGELSYAELDARANRLARVLHAAGVGPDVKVGVRLDRSIEMIVTVLAIGKAGGAYVPIDPAWPRLRVEQILGPLKARALVTQAAHLEDLRELKEALPELGAIVCIDAEDEARHIAQQSSERLPRTGSSDNIAYIIFTSGSTGVPKGVVVRHQSAVNIIEWVNRTFAIGPEDRLLFVTALSFDLSVYDVFGMLAAGGSIRVAASAELRDPERLFRVLQDEPITFWDSAPALLETLAPLFPGHEVAARLRLVFLSGDWVPISMPGRLWQTFGKGCKVVALGGATEATVWSNFHVVDEVRPGWVSIPYGRPIQNARYYVLDAHLQPCPVGVPGDLYIAGPCLADGYTNPVATAERFIADPFGQPGERMYTTGDRARFWADGTMEFLGRLDQQVKIRGFRIELGDIEAALTSHADVRTALVVVRKEESGDRRLIGYVVREPGKNPRSAELRAYVKDRLPEYMIPSAFVVLDALPVTPNGKVDRKALPAPDAGGATEYLAPRTRAEAAVAQLFAEVLRVPVVGVRDNFFELGGHSLLAIRLFSAIEARLGTKLPLTTLFRAPTVEALARAVDGAVAIPKGNVMPLRTGGVRAPLVCIHPGGGTLLGYHALITRLAADRPCFGIESRGLADDELPAATVSEMAEAYARRLLAVCDKRPFHLAGWSFGGIVAVELAKILRAGGNAVATITMIDTFAPSAFPQHELDEAAVLAELALDLGVEVKEDELRALGPEAALAHVVGLAHGSGVLPAHVGAEQLVRRLRVLGANLRAHQRYEPGLVDGRVVLVRAMEGIGIDPATGWRAHMSQGIEIKDVPGSHFTMVRPPHVDALARIVDGVLGQI